jgi:hypothetical protein
VTDQATIPAAGGAVIPPEKLAPPAGAQDAQPTPAEEAPGEAAAENAGTEGAEEQPRVTRAQLRIRELARERNSFRNERDTLAARLAALEQPIIAADRIEELDYRDRERLTAREAIREERKVELQEQVQTAHQRSLAASANAVVEMIQAANDPDLHVLLTDSSVPITDEIVEFLAETDQAVPIAKELAKNPQLLRHLGELTFRGNRQSRGTATRASLREADRILLGMEARFKAGISAPQQRTATKAPAPGTTLNGGAPPKDVVPLHEVSDMDTYMARRRAAWAKGQP